MSYDRMEDSIRNVNRIIIIILHLSYSFRLNSMHRYRALDVRHMANEHKHEPIPGYPKVLLIV